MINKRKKKKENIKSFIDIDRTDSGYSSDWTPSDFDTTEDSSNASSALDTRLENQISAIQTDRDNRAAAEESNLDILDRGSRYVRKNEKLKKFKV